MAKVTNEDIVRFNELYVKLKTYAAVARETSFSASTVKRYIIEGYVPKEQVEVKRFDKKLPDFPVEKFRAEDWASFCVVTEEEKEELKELWKELSL